MFEDKVAEYMTKNNCTKIEAMSAVVNKHPDLHQDFIQRAQIGKVKPIRTFVSDATTFEALVKAYRKQKKCLMSAAIRTMAKENPYLYGDYLGRIKTGQAKPIK